MHIDNIFEYIGFELFTFLDEAYFCVRSITMTISRNGLAPFCVHHSYFKYQHYDI